MELKDIKLVKGMTRDEVNELTKEYILLEDEVYLGNKYKHNWRCLCGNTIERDWGHIKHKNLTKCEACKIKLQEDRYKYEVEKCNDYKYIKYFKTGSKLPGGKVSKIPYLQVEHIYCGNIYEIQAGQFISENSRCSKCCHKYENSFAYHIEVELGLKLEDVWDFEKNTVNPYHIWKSSGKKVWVKCKKVGYHGSYEVSCNSFTKGSDCVYCSSKKIHPLDSFGYHHFDKVMSWHPDNSVSPFRISLYNNKKYKFICETCGYEWSAMIGNISKGKWYPQCKSSKGEKKISMWLNKNNIKYEIEKEFDDLISDLNVNLRYDFYLPEYNLLIEYQGEQHEKYIPGFHENKNSFKRQKEHDKRKKIYAKNNNVKLLEIWYWDFDNIEEILSIELKL
ncbi:hypothetical protein UT300012_32180 [Paraclostridium bifermentans]